MNKKDAGIGSRETPADVCGMMTVYASKLAGKGYVLRSGGANGADAAFELGCDLVDGEKEIYLPWRGFMGNSSPLHNVSLPALNEAKRFHPNWSRLNDAGRRLMGRNAYQVLGANLSVTDKVDFILFWTEDGKASGGTGQALRMAKYYEIPAYCIGRDNINHIVN